MPTIHVPADYPTIQQAINAAMPNDTIIVAANTYNEKILIDKTLTLRGAQAGVDARTRPFVAANESIITFSLTIPADFGSGIVNLRSPNIVFDGFTVQGTGAIVNSTGAIYAGDPGQFLPNTATIDVTGLQIINNIIQNNANGVMIASIEPSPPKNPNYLVKFNYLVNNSGDANSGDGQGVFFNNSNTGPPVLPPMTGVLVTQNLFNGSETSASVNLAKVNSSSVTNNVMNQDNSIALNATDSVTVSGNVMNATQGSSVFLIGNTNLTISDNLLYTGISNGIRFFGGNSNVTVTGNCIVGNAVSGIVFNSISGVNSNVTINNNNIETNGIGLGLDANSYTIPPNLNALNNYWGSASGPNYNGTGPGSGQAITDNNIPATVSVDFTPFLTSEGPCASPVTLTKTSTSVNVEPGMPISFQVSFTVAADQATFKITSFTDPLPALNGGQPWAITSQSPSNFFTLSGATGSQILSLTSPLPLLVGVGTYTVTLTANTNTGDAGRSYDNTVSMDIQYGGLTGLVSALDATAAASLAVCIHRSSLIKLANGKDIEVWKLKPGQAIMGADGKATELVEAVPCWVSDNKWYSGDCIVFEIDSLAPGVPYKRFAVDAGHPICAPQDYAQEGQQAVGLRLAKTFINRKKGISKLKWVNVVDLFPGEENLRYDLIMKDDSCKAFIANGVVVQARKSRLVPGYKCN